MLNTLNNWLEKQPLLHLADKLGKLAILVSVVSFAFKYSNQSEDLKKNKTL